MEPLTPEQRLLRRLYASENLGIFLDEMAFYRKHAEEMRGEKTVLWTWDEEEGSNASAL